MKVVWSNYKDYYKNPTPEDFSNSNVWLRRTHLRDIITDWKDWSEDDFGVIDWINNNNFRVVMETKLAPNIVKITTNDGTDWYFYKLEQPAIISEADKTVSTILYTLNKWDTYLYDKFFQLNELNPQVETLNLHSDIIIFYWSLGRIVDLGITSFEVDGFTEREIRDGFNYFIKASNDDWKTGDINPYYSINYEYLDTTELSDLQVNDKVSWIGFSDDFSVNQVSDTPPAFYGIDFDDGNASLYLDDLGGGELQVQYRSTLNPQDDAPIWTSDNGFIQNDYDWADGTHWDAATKTLTFASSKTILSNNITSDNYSGFAGTFDGMKVKIKPRTVNGKTYFTTNQKDGTDLGYIELDAILIPPEEIYELEVNNKITYIYFSSDFSASISDEEEHYLVFGADEETAPFVEIWYGTVYYGDGIDSEDYTIYDFNNGGFQPSHTWSDGTKWDADTRTLTFNKDNTVYENTITEETYTGNALTNNNKDKPRVDILYYKLNILEQKQFSDTRANDNYQLIRKYIGTKTPSQLYMYNQVEQIQQIQFRSFGDASKTYTTSLGELDNISWDAEKNVYKQIGCKASALKTIYWDSGKITGIESVGGQYQLFIPIGDREIALFDKIGDWLQPTPTSSDSTQNPEPHPDYVQLAPLASGSKLTDATLSDLPNGLLMYLAQQQIGAQPQFANLGKDASTGSSENYAWSDSASVVFMKLPTNKAVEIKISELDEPNSLENKIKTIFRNICAGIYDENTEPLFLNPKYFYEAIIYDNTNFIKIDTSWLNYEILADEIDSDGLVLIANWCITNDFAMWYTFGSASGNGKIGNNELNTDWNITKTNLWVDNNRTTLELGSNAENLANGGALAAQVGYLNNKTTIDMQTRNNQLSQIGNAFGLVGDVAGAVANIGFAGGGGFMKSMGGVSAGITDVMGMMVQQQNFNDTILKENRSYNASISQIKSAAATDVSLPFTTSFGKQDGLFTRCSYEIQDWNKRSKFLEINKTGYIYRDSNYFQVWDNRLYWNTIKISSNQNYHTIIQDLQKVSSPQFSAYMYNQELVIWLCGGITICNLINLPKIETLQNLPKVLPPTQNIQKLNWTKFINSDELLHIGIVGDNTMSWNIDGELRNRLINLFKQYQIKAPDDLWDDLNTDNFTWTFTQTTLEIVCNNTDAKYYGTLQLSNIFVIDKVVYFQNIGSFIINDYANNKEYYDLHIQYQLGNINKDDGIWDSIDYTFVDENTLHIAIINTFMNITILDYTVNKSDTQSIGYDTLFSSNNWSWNIGSYEGTMYGSGIWFGNTDGVNGGGVNRYMQTDNGKNNLVLQFICMFSIGNVALEYNSAALFSTSVKIDLVNKTFSLYNFDGDWLYDIENPNGGSEPLEISTPNKYNVATYGYGAGTSKSYNLTKDLTYTDFIDIKTDKIGCTINFNKTFKAFKADIDNHYSIDWNFNDTSVNAKFQTNTNPTDSFNVSTDMWSIGNSITISNNDKDFVFNGFTWS